MTARQRDALISFCLNVGAGALERSTLRKRLLAGEPAAVVLAQELPRWCKGPNGPVEGLKRRRAAEVAHAQGPTDRPLVAAPAERSVNAPSATMQLLHAVRYHRELPHQLEAWQLLQRSLSDAQLSAFAAAFRAPTAPIPSGLIELPVPYLSQNDSSTGQGSRMCFASTCAMAAAFLRPGCLNGSGQLDDHYLALVQRHGDTTETSAQVSALQSFGIKARFRTDGAIDALIEELQRGIPCPVGWLHKGLAPAPHGGGHWSLV